MVSPDSTLVTNGPSGMSLVWATYTGLLSAVLLYRTIKHRTWFFYLMCLGAVFLFVSFILLAVVHPIEDGEQQTAKLATPALVALALQVFGPSIIAVACYMVLARLIWFAAPHDQQGSKKLGISLPHFTLVSATLELLSLLLVFVGGLLLIHNGRYEDEFYWYRKADTSFRVLIAGLVLQLLIRFYLFCVGLRVSSLRKNWNPTTPKMRFGPRTSIVNMNMCGALLTVQGFEIDFHIHTNEPCSSEHITVSHYSGTKAKQPSWSSALFDNAPVMIVVLLSTWMHPGKSLPRSFTKLRLSKKALVSSDSAAELGSTGSDIDGQTLCSVDVHDEARHADEAHIREAQEDGAARRLPQASVARSPDGHTASC